MAESLQDRCSDCKRMGITRCDGCGLRFCSSHFSEHRSLLDVFFEEVCNERDTLCDQINNPHLTSSLNRNAQLTRLIKKINEWETVTLKMVAQAAEHARNDVNELMVSTNKSSKIELDKVSEELIKRKEAVNYFEQDIERLHKNLERIQMNLDVEYPQIQINTLPIDWSTILRISSSEPKRDIYQEETQLFSGGTLLSRKHQIVLNEFYGNENEMWKLLYKGTRNGFNVGVCHQCCDDQGPTLTIIRCSQGFLFGGYTSISWGKTVYGFSTDKTAFLFTLINPHGIPPTKYRINADGTQATMPCFVTGPTFGAWDICIHLNESDQHDHSNIGFPADYTDSTGKGDSTFTGDLNFSIADIEIYRLTASRKL